MDDGQETGTRILDIKQVCGRLGLARATLYRMIQDGRFPRPLSLSKRRVGWPDGIVESWIENLQPK